MPAGWARACLNAGAEKRTAWRGAFVHFINAQTSAHRVQRRVIIGASPMDTIDVANLMLRQPLAEHPLGEAEYASPSHASGVDCLSKCGWQTRQLKVASGGGGWFAGKGC